MSAKAARMEDTQTQTIEVMGIPPELGRDRDRQRSGSQKPPAADADADADADEDEDMDTAPPEDLGLEEMYGFGNPWPLCPFAVYPLSLSPSHPDPPPCRSPPPIHISR